MELVELMSRNEREKELNAAADEGNATGLKKKGTCVWCQPPFSYL
jgi:hypothetical protein